MAETQETTAPSAPAAAPSDSASTGISHGSSLDKIKTIAKDNARPITYTLIPTVVIWVLLYLNLLPRYERTPASDLMSYFFPLAVAVAYAVFAIARPVLKEYAKNETPEQIAWRDEILEK
jgi:hypothetical protein